jgi:hypothetical protein
MPDDPVVDEVRQRRAELVEAAGGTLETLVKYLKQREAAAGRTPVRLPPRAPDLQSRAG